MAEFIFSRGVIQKYHIKYVKFTFRTKLIKQRGLGMFCKGLGGRGTLMLFVINFPAFDELISITTDSKIVSYWQCVCVHLSRSLYDA